MPYFLPDQVKTIRQQWIPGLAQVAAAGVSVFLLNSINRPSLQILSGLPFLLFTAWIFLQARDWKKLTRYGTVWLIAQTAAIFLSSLIISREGNVGWHILINNCFVLICLLARQYVQDGSKFFVKGVLLWIFLSAGSSAFVNFINSNMALSPDIPLHTGMRVFQFTLVGLTGFATPYIFHAFAFLLDNYFTIPEYKSLLRSKVLVTGKKTYAFMYFVLFMTIIGSAFQLTGSMSFLYIVLSSASLFEGITGVVLSAVLFIMAVLAFAAIFVSLYLMRNIITGRMATVKMSNGLIYAMHYIPLFNLLAVFFNCEAVQEHNSRKENATFYIQRNTSPLAHWIVALGIIVAIINVIRTWLAYNSAFSSTYPSYFREESSGEYQFIRLSLIIIIALYFIKVLGYILLYNHRKAVHLIVILNIAIMALSLFEVLPLVLLFSTAALASFYVMLEIFHPALHDEDALLITESYPE